MDGIGIRPKNLNKFLNLLERIEKIMRDCRRCKHPYSVHTGECPCAPGKKICEWKEGCLCRQYVDHFHGERSDWDE